MLRLHRADRARSVVTTQLPLARFRSAARRGRRRAFAYVGERERERFARAVRERETAVRERLERAGWRVGPLYEDDAARGLAQTFGLHAIEGIRR